MTRASPARVDRLNGRKVATGDAPFPMPPPGMLSEQIDLVPFRLVLGLIHPDDCPMLIAVWDGQRLKRVLPEEASSWADSLIEAGQALPLAPVIAAIRKLVKRVGDIVMESMARETVH